VASTLFSFPSPVNEKAARTVAAVVCALSITALATGWYWILAVLAYGFLARVFTGPTLSPLGRLATSVIAPRLGAPKPVPGPPKRFAQGMGAVMASAGAIVALGFGVDLVGIVFLALIVLASFLESAFAICLGCEVFALLMRAGVIPASVCAECADIGLAARRRSAAAA
jgi:hypothetical protein